MTSFFLFLLVVRYRGTLITPNAEMLWPKMAKVWRTKLPCHLPFWPRILGCLLLPQLNMPLVSNQTESWWESTQVKWCSQHKFHCRIQTKKKQKSAWKPETGWVFTSVSSQSITLHEAVGLGCYCRVDCGFQGACNLCIENYRTMTSSYFHFPIFLDLNEFDVSFYTIQFYMAYTSQWWLRTAGWFATMTRAAKNNTWHIHVDHPWNTHPNQEHIYIYIWIV